MGLWIELINRPRLGPGGQLQEDAGQPLIAGGDGYGAVQGQLHQLRWRSACGQAQQTSDAAVELLHIEGFRSRGDILQDGFSLGQDHLGMSDIRMRDAGAHDLESRRLLVSH